MDTTKAALVVGITLVLVVLINVWIYLAFSRKNTIGQIEILQKAARHLKNPWQSEDNDLQELSRLVKGMPRHPNAENLPGQPGAPDPSGHETDSQKLENKMQGDNR